MKTITYNPETHVLVPIEPSEEMIQAGKDVFCDTSDHSEEAASNDYRNVFKGMLAAAPQPEPVDGKPVDYLLDGARFKLSFQEIECDECGTESPYVLVTPLDQYANELNGKWVALVPAENDRHLHMTPPPDRTAELEAALSKFKDALFDVLIQDMSRDKALAKINEVLK